MNQAGFYLKTLRVIGESKSSEIELVKGLNVIYGPTNTGKSYIFECINFMLGGKDAPNEIPEVKDCTTIFLEIVSYSDNQHYTLVRELTGGGFKLYECSIDLIAFSSYKGLSSKLSKKSASVSELLLKLCGYENTNMFVKKSKKEKQRYSYRNFNAFVMVNEEKIITKKSPVYTDSNKTKTAEDSIFSLILTNREDSNIENLANKNGSSGKGDLEMLDRLIEDISQKVEQGNLQEPEDIESRIVELVTSQKDVGEIIEQLTLQRKELWEKRHRYESKKLSTNEMINRFKILSKHYDSDINRMEFLIIGEHYFTQLTVERCPYCKTSFTPELTECLHEKPEIEVRIEAYQAEIKKVKMHLVDLGNTISDMQEELSIVNKEIEEVQRQYQIVSDKLQVEFQPKWNELEIALRNLLQLQKEQIEYSSNRETLSKLLFERNRIVGVNSNSAPKTDSEGDFLDDDIYRELGKHAQYFLKNWNFPGAENVVFDQEKNDLIISGKSRVLFGKGYRSIAYSAFILGLMRFCREKKLPHPGVVILDSPITSYKEEDSDEDKPSEEVQNAFYKSLSNLHSDEQVIIMENKKPDENLLEKIKFIEFTKLQGKGRYGFIQ